MQGIKIINSRDVVFNEFEMPCEKNKIDNLKIQDENGTSQSEVKLARPSYTQFEIDESGVEKIDENAINTY